MHRFVLCSLWLITGVVLGSLVGGCASSEKRAETSGEAHGAMAESRRETLEKDPLSYGNVTSRIQKGVTTQGDLVELFGGPNISTIDADGRETWVYERAASESNVTGKGQGTIEARRLDFYFNLGLLGGGTERAKEAGSSEYQQSISNSIKTLTVIIKFNEDRTVKEYSARASRF